MIHATNLKLWRMSYRNLLIILPSGIAQCNHGGPSPVKLQYAARLREPMKGVIASRLPSNSRICTGSE